MVRGSSGKRTTRPFIVRFITNYYHEPITVADVLAHVNVSRTTLDARMKKAIGKTPRVAIVNARIKRAKKMLSESNATIFEIAQDSGFVRQEQFNVVFKRQTGMTPSQFRRLCMVPG